jgi:hypothetical protein
MVRRKTAAVPAAPVFAAGAQAETDKVEEVARLINGSAGFSLLAVHDPSLPSQTVPLLPFLREQLLVAIHLNAPLHRFEVVTQAGPDGLTASNHGSQAPVGELHGRLTLIPDDFVPGPGLLPPPTVLNPFRSQRLTLLNGQLSFRDRRASGLQAFGTGRTFPVTIDGRASLKIGAVIDVLSGSGDLAGLPGDTHPGATLVINGYLRPPDELVLHLALRVLDPERRLEAVDPVLPMVPSPALPDPGAVSMSFLGEVDPQRPVRLLFGPEGRPIGCQLFERLRLLRCDDELETSGRLRSRSEPGPVVGSVSSMLYFDLQAPGPVIPAQTTGGVFSFHDLQGRSFGSLFANLVEGRAFRTALPGAPSPVFRLGGFGPVKGGTGLLAGVTGMLSANSVISFFPRTFSNLYVFRLDDPDGRLRAVLPQNSR